MRVEELPLSRGISRASSSYEDGVLVRARGLAVTKVSKILQVCNSRLSPDHRQPKSIGWWLVIREFHGVVEIEIYNRSTNHLK
jgi:hypothetical protein